MHYRTGEGPAEFLEVTLLATEDPADYTVSFYTPSGTLQTAIPVTGAVGGEITLDAASVTAVADPDNPDYVIYTITSNTGYLFTAGSTASGEARAVTLTNTDTSTVIDAYNVNGGTTTTTQGAGSGVTTAPSGAAGSNQSVHWDIFGNQTSGTYTPDDAVLCFHSDVRIQTATGECRAGNLKVGDLVKTLDHGYQPIRWIHKTPVSPQAQQATSKNCPIQISKGALGDNYPERDLLVSPQHRILLQSRICERMFRTSEVLVNAKSLLTINGVTQLEPGEEFSYVHILFGKHEIVFANGQPCESLLPGEMVFQTLSQVDSYALEEALSKYCPVLERVKPSRPIVRGHAVRKMIARHKKNEKPLVDLSLNYRSSPLPKAS
ncbi:Hint domain-containing protein [Roseibacterium beibuensis]|uniref:Hedgehog/Intein (Hint) domain-containing protein n=1 Tax=[Roseibacterium] beibuensis TaxID=1193142 RepID=A0ABP9L0U3_9RHOB|nr:Hint domain-containing protein [Roseibacterium beibuensis]MCS6621819.1 Hint domain-containing protein [Roseibacterium beibuensis]